MFNGGTLKCTFIYMYNIIKALLVVENVYVLQLVPHPSHRLPLHSVYAMIRSKPPLRMIFMLVDQKNGMGMMDMTVL